MADPALPVLDQPAAVPVPAEPDQVPGEQDEAPAEGGGGVVVKSSSWWEMSNLTLYPHLLDQSITSIAINVAQVSSHYLCTITKFLKV